MTEIIFQGTSNVASIVIQRDQHDGQGYVPVPLADMEAVQRVTLQLTVNRKEIGPLIDSAEDPDAITWGDADGRVSFELGALLADVKPGAYQGILTLFDGLHPNGQVVAHPAAAELVFRVV